MELLRDLVRDVVGIIFPGALVVLLIAWFFLGTMILLVPPDLLGHLGRVNPTVSFSAALVLSYVAGNLLRMKQLSHVENKCTQYYRRARRAQLQSQGEPDVDDEEFTQSIKTLDENEKRHSKGELTMEELTAAYEAHGKRFLLWEEFPYPYGLRGKTLSRCHKEYNKFFEKYVIQGLTRTPTFFHFCKSVIYEYSSSFKEEVLRQEAIVRLFSGLYYAMQLGTTLNIIVGLVHLVAMVTWFLGAAPSGYTETNYSYSCMILAGSVLSLIVFWYLIREILKRLRYMRVKELSLAFDGFYIICNKHNLDF